MDWRSCADACRLDEIAFELVHAVYDQREHGCEASVEGCSRSGEPSFSRR